MGQGPTITRFCRSMAELLALCLKLKLEPCPYCHLTGFLILHDWLYGYSESSLVKIRKGKRIFCSNRNLRKGCGRTFILLLAYFIRRIRIRTNPLWDFLSNCLRGKDKRNAFRLACPQGLSDSTLYRIWNRFKERQSFLRERLFRRMPQPPAVKTSDPVLETIRHLKAAFPKTRCPLRAFQLHFQVSCL